MQYNIYYEMASIFYVAVLLIYLIYKYPNASAVNKSFRRLTTSVLVADVFDVVSSVAISYPSLVPKVVNLLLAAGSHISTSFIAFYFVRYVDAFLDSEARSRVLVKVNKVVAWMYVFFVTGSIPFKYCFYFDENMNYNHGPLFIGIFIILMYFIASGGMVLLLNRDKLDKKQFYFTILFLVVAMYGEIAQTWIVPDQLVGLFATSVALFIVLLSLETPDYQKLMETMDKLEQAKNEADIANVSKSRFLARMSHEIRTPINAIIGMNEMILRESDNDEIKQYAMDVKSSSITLLGIINDILDTSKIESGKMELVPTKYDSYILIRDIINMISYKANEKGLKLICDIDENMPSKLYGDDVRLKQIIVNILSNAVKYTEKGSVSFKITGQIKNDCYNMHVEVSDTGIGIKEENISKLFDAFERFDESKNKYVEGTGLGMNISKQLLSLMDSEIKVQSTYGEGSTFSFDVVQNVIDREPVGNIMNRSKVEVKQNEGVAQQYNNADLKGEILVVDDNDLNRKVIIQLLKNTELEVKEASSGRSAIRIAKKQHFDIILLDHMMPEMDGIETLSALKGSDDIDIQGTKIIVMTANNIVGAKEEYLETGFDDFISKPIFPEELNKVIAKWL